MMMPSRASPARRPIHLNVGGTLFHTNTETLQAAGEGSLLATIAQEAASRREKQPFSSSDPDPDPGPDPDPFFIDRDAELFGILLFALRSKRLPLHLPDGIDLNMLIHEASHFGMSECFRSCISPPPMDGLDTQKIRVLLSNGRDHPSAIAVSPQDGSLCLGHGNKITSYDWALRRCNTTLTELCTIQSLHMLSNSVAAIGAPDMPGLHVYDVSTSKHKKSFMWSDTQDPRVFNPSVHAITSSPSSVFVSFSSLKGGDNTLALVDPERLEVVEDIGRQRGLATVASNKLEWMNKRGLLVAGVSAGSPFGYNGHLRLFDVRSKDRIWEWKEPNMRLRPKEKDCFADWATSDELDGIFKIGITSGQLEFLDLRKMRDGGKEEDPWMAMEETAPSLEKGEGGASNLLAVCGRQVFCSRRGDLEVWAEVPLQLAPDEEYWENAFRRNYVDQRRNMDTITNMASGGNRLFVTREEFQGVEVWETQCFRKL